MFDGSHNSNVTLVVKWVLARFYLGMLPWNPKPLSTYMTMCIVQLCFSCLAARMKTCYEFNDCLIIALR